MQRNKEKKRPWPSTTHTYHSHSRTSCKLSWLYPTIPCKAFTKKPNISTSISKASKARPRSTCKPTWQTMQRHTKTTLVHKLIPSKTNCKALKKIFFHANLTARTWLHASSISTYAKARRQRCKLQQTKSFPCSSCTLDHFHANIASRKAFMYIRQGHTHGLRNETTRTLMAHSSSIQAHSFKKPTLPWKDIQRPLSANKANFGLSIQDMQR